jgi:hypothetical protein
MTEDPGKTVDPTGVDLRSDLLRLKQEVDSIQISMMSAAKPWYRQISSLVAVVALVFSFGTTYVSYQHTAKQDTQAARAALRALLQRATSLPKENLELFKKYQDSPADAQQLSSFINQENTILAAQALELIDELGDVVSASELLAASYAAGTAGMLPAAERLTALAATRASNFTDAVAALRTQAAQAYAYGNLVAGQAHYTEALSIFSRFPNPSQDIKHFTHLQTEGAWAYSEMGAGRCEPARQHLLEARGYVARLSEPIRSQQSRVLDVAEAALVGRCGKV